MTDINPNVSHISCQKCNRGWQVLMEGSDEWDENKTAEAYTKDRINCKECIIKEQPIC